MVLTSKMTRNTLFLSYMKITVDLCFGRHNVLSNTCSKLILIGHHFASVDMKSTDHFMSASTYVNVFNILLISCFIPKI